MKSNFHNRNITVKKLGKYATKSICSILLVTRKVIKIKVIKIGRLNSKKIAIFILPDPIKYANLTLENAIIITVSEIIGEGKIIFTSTIGMINV
tara:strand:+ start:2210 stop:2491 length:282 start_codon:yes stop_codon:yes gene_type:complete